MKFFLKQALFLRNEDITRRYVAYIDEANNLPSCILGFVFVLTFYSSSTAQVLHLGVRLNSTPYQHLSNKNEYAFHYNNSANESYFVKGLKNNQLTTIQYENAKFLDLPAFLIPAFYVRYDFKNDFFTESELHFTYHHNEITGYKYDDIGNSPMRDGNIKVNFYYISNSLHFGYKLLRTKRVRPYLTAGVNVLYLVDFATTGAVDNKELKESNTSYYRVKLVLDRIDNFSKITALASVGLGIGYRAFNFRVVAETNVSPVDYSATPYYDRFFQVTVGIGYHFLSFDLLSKKNKQFIRKKLTK